jgi:uncharacterized membrane protein YidH (DUF202 family)
VIDPGAQPERTLLAWRRTSLSLVAAALVALHLAQVSGSALAVAAAVLCLVLALATVAESQYAHGNHAESMASPRPAFWLLATAAGAVVTLALVGVFLAVH